MARPEQPPLPEILEASGEADDGAFLKRWSARKLRHQERQAAVQSPASTPLTSPEEAESHAPADADMPPLESLDENSDYSPFFSPRVSAELRRLALRKLFRSPGFNITDGLDDYDEDFTQFAKLGDIVTHDMRRMMELEAERERAKAKEAQRGQQDTFHQTNDKTREADCPSTTEAVDGDHRTRNARDAEHDPRVPGADDEDLEA
jgi:hypothetical protein